MNIKRSTVLLPEDLLPCIKVLAACCQVPMHGLIAQMLYEGIAKLESELSAQKPEQV